MDSVNILEIILLNDCNLRCDYCFIDKRVSKQLSAEQIKDFIIKHYDFKPLEINFLGGEPLIAFDLVKKIVLSIPETVKQNCTFHLSTNGYLLTEEIITFFRDNKVTISYQFFDKNHNYLFGIDITPNKYTSYY